MPIMDVVRRRRRRRGPAGHLTLSARLGLVLVTLLLLTLGVVASGVAAAYLEVIQRVPAIEDINAFFMVGEEPGFVLPRIVDRHGVEISKVQHPATEEAQWVTLEASGGIEAPERLVEAIVVAQDPSYWQGDGYRWIDLVRTIPVTRGATGERKWRSTITVQLVEATLLPLEAAGQETLEGQFQRGLLAQRLALGYDEQTLLTWYLNSAYFGRGIYGVDAASLAYFDRHVDQLTLGQSALLAAMAGGGDDILDSSTATRRAQREVLEAMVDAEVLDRREMVDARARPLRVSRPPVGDSPPEELFERVMEEASHHWGEEVDARGGLTLWTTLDLDIQQQAECSLRSQITRLTDGEIAASVPDREGGPCLAAALLPPLRPGSLSGSDKAGVGLVLILDPDNGELLAWADGGEGFAVARRPAGKMLYPFVYLAAFSRGMSPATMILDIPSATELAGLTAEEVGTYLGPTSMRRGLMQGAPEAAKQALELAGSENVERTLRELGINDVESGYDLEAILDGTYQIDPIVLARAYGTLANNGVLIDSGTRSTPSILSGIEDRFGRSLPSEPMRRRVVLGESLTYLIQHALSEVATGGELVGGANSLGIRRQAAVVQSETPGAGGAWGLTMTPNQVVLVWMEANDGIGSAQAIADLGPVPVAAAMSRYASQDLPPLGWERPRDVAEVEVCVPSGQLPTAYCPEVRSELFLLGTEPTAFDSLYQPYRINRDSGNLATLQTPLEKVEERVFLVPPPEAQSWAKVVGWERPPSSYDTLTLDETGVKGVKIEEPMPFALVRGQVPIRGEADVEGLDYYRVQVGQGLNPSRWTQVGQDHARRAGTSVLERWDTQDLNGLFTIQLVVVLEDGEIRTDSVPVTVDNEAPAIRILQPAPEAVIEETGSPLLVEIAADDPYGTEQVAIYLDGRLETVLDERPFVARLEMPGAGTHSLLVKAEDQVGNRSQSEERVFYVER